MKYKIWLIGLSMMLVLLCGCVEESSSQYRFTTQETQSRYIEENPLVQTISGVNKEIVISGDVIKISGVRNSVTILNNDISAIYISGVDNIVLYPRTAQPRIVDSGVDCIISVY